MEMLFRGLMTAKVEAEYNNAAQMQMEEQALEQAVAQGILKMLLGEE